MCLDLAGVGVDARAGAREDARDLSSGKVGGDNGVWGALYYIQITGSWIQDTRQHHAGHRRQE